jgi:hypothetical protein
LWWSDDDEEGSWLFEVGVLQEMVKSGVLCEDRHEHRHRFIHDVGFADYGSW